MNVIPENLQFLVTTVLLQNQTTLWELTAKTKISKSTLHDALKQRYIFGL